MANINGNNKANTLRGTSGHDDIEGRGGDDRLFGRGRGGWHCNDVMHEGEFAIDDGTYLHHDSIALSFEAV